MYLPPETRIRSAADLTRAWRTLRGGLGFDDLTLWVLRIDPDGRAGPLFTVGGLPDGPYDVEHIELDGLVGEYLQGGAAALLYGRPGRGPWRVGDRAWARWLLGYRQGGPGVHLARDGDLVRVDGPAALATLERGRIGA